MARRHRLLPSVLIGLSLGLAVAGCETLDKLNPFEEKQTPLPGARKPLFPEGVPGVEFGAAPLQPTNSNIPIPANTAPAESESRAAPAQAARTAPPAKAAPTDRVPQADPQPAPPPASKAAKAKKSGDPDDAWSGTR
jgi:hypothetical protein